MSAEAPAVMFYALGLLAVLGALGVVFNLRNTVAGALSLVGAMASLAGIYVLQDAFFIGAVQVLVYAGAIMVLFLFVVMLLNLRGGNFAPARRRAGRVLAVLLGLAALGQQLHLLSGAFGPARALPEGFGGYRQIGALLFTDYVLAFQVASLLLLASMVGAVILAKRDIGEGE